MPVNSIFNSTCVIFLGKFTLWCCFNLYFSHRCYCFLEVLLLSAHVALAAGGACIGTGEICCWTILPLNCQCKWKGDIDGWVADSIINHCKFSFKLILLKNYVYYFFSKNYFFQKVFCNFKIVINFSEIFSIFFKIYYFDNFFNK